MPLSNAEVRRRYRARHPERVREQARTASRRSRDAGRTRARITERRAYVASLKDNPCLDCGVKYPPAVMEFDHVRGEKRDAISRMLTTSLERLHDEIAKCDLVCANCHRMRTEARRANR